MTEKENVIPMFKSGKGKAKPTPKQARKSDQAVDRKIDKPSKVDLKTLDKSPADKGTEKESDLSFAEIMKRNAENKDRLKKERLKANQKVIRTHRLKH